MPFRTSDLQRPPRSGLAVAVGRGRVGGAGDLPERRRHPRRAPRARLLPQRGRALSMGRAVRSGALRRYPPPRQGRALGRVGRLVHPARHEPAGDGIPHPDDRRGPSLFPRPLRRRPARRLQFRFLRPQRRPAADPAPRRLRDVRPHAAAGGRARRSRPTSTAGAASTARSSRPTASPSGSITPNTTTSRSGSAPASLSR